MADQVYVARRTLLGGAACVGLTWYLPPEAAASAIDLASGQERPVDPELRSRALLALSVHAARLATREVVAIADFGPRSTLPRFHVLHLPSGNITTYLVAHGRGSDPHHTGFLQSFCNRFASNATSCGSYVTADLYVGAHGLSRRLTGLDATNYNAEARTIMIHAAPYVGPDVIVRQGRLGRSDGCFVFAPQDIAAVLARLRRGTLLFAGRSDAVDWTRANASGSGRR